MGTTAFTRYVSPTANYLANRWKRRDAKLRGLRCHGTKPARPPDLCIRNDIAKKGKNMRTLKTLYKRSFALFLAIALCVSTPQFTAFAEDSSPEVETSAEQKMESDATDIANPDAGNEESQPSVQEDGTDGGENSGSTTEPWEGTVGKEPDQIEVSGTQTTTPIENGEKVTWEGTGENEDKEVTVNGEETTTKETTERDEQDRPLKENETVSGSEAVVETPKAEGASPDAPVEINPGDPFSKGDVTVTVTLPDVEVGDDGMPVLGVGFQDYILDQDASKDGVYIFKKTEIDGSDSTISLEAVTDQDGKVTGFKHVNTGKLEVNKDAIVESLKPVPPTDKGYIPSKKEDGTDIYVNTETNEDGSIISTSTWEVEEIPDPKDAHAVIGYKTIQSTTITKVDDTGLDLNVRPENSTETDNNGNVTNVLVEDVVDAFGNVVGYKVTTTVTSADGKNVTSEIKTITTEVKDLGNGTSTTQTVTSTTTSVITVVTSSQEVTDITDGEVKVTVDGVTEGDDHGALRTESLKPNMGFDPEDKKTNTTSDLYGWEDGQYYRVNASKGMIVREKPDSKSANVGGLEYGKIFYVSQTKEAGGYIWGRIGENQWVALGWSSKTEVAQPSQEDDELGFYGKYGLSSAVIVDYVNNDPNGKDGRYNVHQFIVKDASGKEHYAYCADLSVSPDLNAVYGMTNVEDAEFLDSEQAKIISAIAVNGYWGVKGDVTEVGSLEYFKAWLRSMNYEGNLDGLTGGVAMSVTQAAIWKYGSSKSLQISDDPFTMYNYDGDYYQYDKLWQQEVKNKKEKAELADKIYKFLIANEKAILDNYDADPDKQATDLINSDNITNVSVTVKKNVNDAIQSIEEASQGSNKNYSADVSFVLDIAPSSVSGDLVVRVIDADGNVIATRRLAGDDSETNYGVIKPVNGYYIITGDDMVLPEGTKITLKLSGTQTVAKGAYVFTASAGFDTSQTFIGVESGERDVDVSVEVNFNVEEAAAVIKTVEPHVTSTETKKSWYSRSETTYEYPSGGGNTPGGDDDDDPTPETPGGDDDDDDTIPDEPTPLGDEPGTEIPEEPTPLADTPVLVELVDEEVPLAGAPELVDLFDEDVPLANVPMTGDISVLWYALIFAAAGCLAVLKGADKKKRNNF